MGRYIAMVVMSFIAGGVLVFVLLSFLRKLKKIEDDFWGTASAEAGRQLEEARREQVRIAEAKSKKKQPAKG